MVGPNANSRRPGNHRVLVGALIAALALLLAAAVPTALAKNSDEAPTQANKAPASDQVAKAKPSDAALTDAQAALDEAQKAQADAQQVLEDARQALANAEQAQTPPEEEVVGDDPDETADSEAEDAIAAQQQEDAPPSDQPETAEPEAEAPSDTNAWGPAELLGELVYPGTVRRLAMPLSESLDGAEVPIPVIAYRALNPGPVLCVTAGIHGDEVNGIEVARRIVDEVNTDLEHGMILSVPIVNLSAVRRASRYLPDRRDLNRYFPGRRYGSSASRIAYHFFENVIRHCSVLIDLHTGSFNRGNLHQLRADLDDPKVERIAAGLGTPTVVNNAGRKGTLRGAAVDAGIPTVTIEAGEPIRLSIDEVEQAVTEIRELMISLEMIPADPDAKPAEAQVFYRQAHWVRAVAGGILVNQVALGDDVTKESEIATVTDPMTSVRYSIFSPYAGKVIGLAFDQLVMPGFAIAHIAVPSKPKKSSSSKKSSKSTTEASPETDTAEPDVDAPEKDGPTETAEPAEAADDDDIEDRAASAYTDNPDEAPLDDDDGPDDHGNSPPDLEPTRDLGARPE